MAAGLGGGWGGVGQSSLSRRWAPQWRHHPDAERWSVQCPCSFALSFSAALPVSTNCIIFGSIVGSERQTARRPRDGKQVIEEERQRLVVVLRAGGWLEGFGKRIEDNERTGRCRCLPPVHIYAA